MIVNLLIGLLWLADRLSACPTQHLEQARPLLDCYSVQLGVWLAALGVLLSMTSMKV